MLSKTETIEKNHEITFEATGTREEGEAASGTLNLSQSGDSDPVTVAQGSAFSAGQCNFITTSSVTIPGAKIKGGVISNGKASVRIRRQLSVSNVIYRRKNMFRQLKVFRQVVVSFQVVRKKL